MHILGTGHRNLASLPHSNSDFRRDEFALTLTSGMIYIQGSIEFHAKFLSINPIRLEERQLQ